MEAAKESYNQALRIDPTLASAANNLAYIMVEEGRDLEVALNWAQTARKKDPDNADNADTLGWVQHKLGSHVLARAQLQFAVSKQPDNPVFNYHLAMIYKSTKQFREAEAALKKALNSKQSFKEKALAEAALRDLSKDATPRS